MPHAALLLVSVTVVGTLATSSAGWFGAALVGWLYGGAVADVADTSLLPTIVGTEPTGSDERAHRIHWDDVREIVVTARRTGRRRARITYRAPSGTRRARSIVCDVGEAQALLAAARHELAVPATRTGDHGSPLLVPTVLRIFLGAYVCLAALFLIGRDRHTLMTHAAAFLLAASCGSLLAVRLEGPLARALSGLFAGTGVVAR